jgi:type VI secretion system FHA domain protein
MVRQDAPTASNAAPVAFTTPEDVVPPAKDESVLADELDNFLAGAQPKSRAVTKNSKPAPVIQKVHVPEVEKAQTEQPTDDLVAGLDDFLKPVTEKATRTAKTAPPPAQVSAPNIEPANKKTDSPAKKITNNSAANIVKKPATNNTVNPATGDINRAMATMLGLEEVPPSALPLLSETAAEVLKESVKGLMLNLRARNQIKSEFRLNMTMIQAAENNPLKFSVTPDDALENMFAKTGKAYMRPVDAVKDGFADISDHQIALFDAMRTAYDHMIAMFDPAQIEAKNPPVKSKGFLSSRKDNQWEQYKGFYQQLTADREQTFKRSFGEVFAEAYEKRMQELKVARIKAGEV